MVASVLFSLSHKQSKMTKLSFGEQYAKALQHKSQAASQRQKQQWDNICSLIIKKWQKEDPVSYRAKFNPTQSHSTQHAQKQVLPIKNKPKRIVKTPLKSASAESSPEHDFNDIKAWQKAFQYQAIGLIEGNVYGTSDDTGAPAIKIEIAGFHYPIVPAMFKDKAYKTLFEFIAQQTTPVKLNLLVYPQTQNALGVCHISFSVLRWQADSLIVFFAPDIVDKVPLAANQFLLRGDWIKPNKDCRPLIRVERNAHQPPHIFKTLLNKPLEERNRIIQPLLYPCADTTRNIPIAASGKPDACFMQISVIADFQAQGVYFTIVKHLGVPVKTRRKTLPKRFANLEKVLSASQQGDVPKKDISKQ